MLQQTGVAPAPMQPQSAPVAAQPAYPQQQPVSTTEQHFPPQPAPVHQPVPLLAPNPHLPQPPATSPAPQPQVNPYRAIYQELASQIPGQTPEQVAAILQDNPANIARAVAQAINVLREPPKQQEPAPAPTLPAAAQADPFGRVPLPEGAERFLQRDPQTGKWAPIAPEYKQYADARNHNEVVDSMRMQQLAANPAALLKDPAVAPTIQKMVDDIVQEKIQKQALDTLRTEVRTKLTPEIMEIDQASGQPRLGLDGRPMMKPLGLAFDKWCRELAESGMKESKQFYAAAEMLARQEVGALAQPSATQQQPQQSWTNPVTQGNVGATPATLQGMLAQAQQANTYWPGQPPPRAPQQQTLNIPGALHMALKDEQENMPASYYFERLGPLLSNGVGR